MAPDVTLEFDPARLADRTPILDPRFATGRHPYYIVAPRYIRTSAGIKALHLLCHCLNRLGLESYIVLTPHWPGPDKTHPELLTPLLDAEAARRHKREGLSPILVYPEVVKGNPYRGGTVARYVMNFPGLLGGDSRYPPQEIVFGYSAILAEAGGAPGRVLYIPASDPTIFHPGPPRDRRGTCFYAQKYRQVHGGELLPATREAIEITRDRPDSQTPQEIAELFRRSELFYAYENTALATEAVLCLCPAVFLPNPWLTEAIAAKELGWDGIAWGDDPAEIARAKATVQSGRDRYLATYAQFWEQLAGIVALTQARAEQDAATGAFPNLLLRRLVWYPRLNYWRSLVAFAWLVLRREGPVSVFRRTIRFTRRRLGLLPPP